MSKVEGPTQLGAQVPFVYRTISLSCYRLIEAVNVGIPHVVSPGGAGGSEQGDNGLGCLGLHSTSFLLWLLTKAS